MEAKICVTCNESKEIAGFDKWRSTCKKCRNKAKKPSTKSFTVCVTEKDCTKCQKVLSASEFYPDASKSSGLASICKPCSRNRVKLQYQQKISLTK
jgi:hypothetical protein